MSPAEFLADAAAREPDDRVEIPIRDLLAIWGFASRGPRAVTEIGEALFESGLTTDPAFASCPDMRDIVRIIPVEAGPTEPETAEADDLEIRFPPVSLCVKELRSACRGVVSVGINDSLQRAQTRMMRHDYSQLAVVDGTVLRGAITWESISAAKIAGSGGSVRNSLMSVSPDVLHPEDKLLDRIPEISRNGFAFVADHQDSLLGIVTTADLSEQFANLAGPFLLISEIERRIRRHIDKVCSLSEIQVAAAFRPTRPLDIQSVHGLTFGGCRKVLERIEIWQRLHWDIDQALFLTDLKGVNTIRNEVMHFRPEPLDPEQIAVLENFAKWLRRLDPLP